MKFSNLVPTTIKLFVFTALFIALFTVFFEFYNTRIHSMELVQVCRQTMHKACRFITQETYRGFQEGEKRRSFGNSYSIKDANGVVVCSGKFYDGESVEEIYLNQLSDVPPSTSDPDGTNDAAAYMDWLDLELHGKDFDEETCKQGETYKMLYNIMSSTKTVDDDKNLGTKLLITPANLGFTYLDEHTLEKVFKWKLLNRLTANSARINDPSVRNLILKDSNGYYALWYGFRIYFDDIKIDISSPGRKRLFDLDDEYDVEELQQWTGIDIERYRWGGENDRGEVMEGNHITEDDIRRYKVLYDIRWTIPIAYEGILPVKQVLTLFQNEEADSLILSDDESPWLNTFYNPLAISPSRRQNDSPVLKTTMNSDGNTIQGNEVLYGEDAPMIMGNNPDTGGRLGNLNDTTYIYDQDDIPHIGYGGDEGVIGLGQRTHYCVIY